MKTKLFTFVTMIILSTVIVSSQTQIEIKADSNTPQYACPKTGYGYYIPDLSLLVRLK